jgi:hypothetical protein
LFWTHKTELLGDVCHVESRFGPFWMHSMVVLGDEAQVEARFSPFRDCANLTQDRCMVCAEHTVGLENILDSPDGTPR